jgi:hypothetical protein
MLATAKRYSLFDRAPQELRNGVRMAVRICKVREVCISNGLSLCIKIDDMTSGTTQKSNIGGDLIGQAL